MLKQWNILPPAPEEFFNTFPELPRIVASLLYHRQLHTQKQIDEFLNPDYSQDVHDPFLFKDMGAVVERINTAVKKNERIIIHGDYDADGVTAAVIFTDYFRAIQFTNFDIFLPHREIDGYGLNKKNVQTFHDEGANLIITCDCGISNYEEVELANRLGMEVIVTDHHAIPERIPPAYAIVHPKLPGETYPDKHLAGGAVAFKVVQALLRRHREHSERLPNDERHESFEKWLLDMVAISSVADMVPLIGESRTLTKYGLIVLNKTKRIGLKKLLLESKLMNDDGSLTRELDAYSIGFRIAPRINAAGRIGHANVAYQLLVAHSGAEAIDLAFELDQNNNERRDITDQFVKEALAQIAAAPEEPPFLFVYGEHWSTGIVGLIASRIKDRFGKPTIAMAPNNGHITGSGRSVEGFNLIEVLQEHPQFFAKFGGHPMACGFSLKDKSVLEEFKQTLTTAFVQRSQKLDLTPRLDIDAEVDLEAIDWKFYDILDKFKPFGQANPEPKYLARGLTITGLRPVGSDGKHLTIMVKHNGNVIRKTIGWQLCNEEAGDGKNWLKLLKIGDKIDLVFEVGVNEWNGNRELQLTIVDLRKHE